MSALVICDQLNFEIGTDLDPMLHSVTPELPPLYQQIIWTALQSAIKNIQLQTDRNASTRLYRWAASWRDAIGLPKLPCRPSPTSIWTRWQIHLDRSCSAPKRASLNKAVEASAEYKSLSTIARAGTFADLQVKILGLALAYKRVKAFEDLWDIISNAYGQPCAMHTEARVLACVLGLRPSQVAHLLSQHPAQMLIDRGLLEVQDDSNDVVTVQIARWIEKGITSTPIQTIEEFQAALIGTPLVAQHSWDDFAHVGDRDVLLSLIQRAVADRISGISILLYGEPGTGKTEFAKTLAATAGCTLIPIGEERDDVRDGEPDRSYRLARLRAAHQWAMPNTVLLVDEADDLFGFGASGFGGQASPTVGSKIYMNQMIERCPVPTIFVVNDQRALSEAALRRMECFHIKIAPTETRKRHWAKSVTTSGIAADDGDLTDLVTRYPVPASYIANSIRTTSLVGGTIATIRSALDRQMEAIKGIPPRPEAPIPVAFNSALGIARDNRGHSIDLEALAQRIKDSGELAVSFCLSGPPGTGKSAFARHLAETMGLRVKQVRASDLLGPYVGTTEAAIASCFERALEEHSFLIFDEADSLLRSRVQASHSWEVSSVNEMLTWMESHPLPFACTTNLIDSLDEATARRFIFKVKFDFLDPAGVMVAFRSFFRCEPPARAAELTCLAPGDFAVVARQVRLFGVQCPEEILKMLEAEKVSRAEAMEPIGFRPV